MAVRQKGEQVGGYRLTRYINSGGESEVWEAQQVAGEGSVVAVKFFVTEQAASTTEKALRRRQFAALADADSDYLCRPIEIGEYDNRMYYVLPLCDGTLEQLCRERGIAVVKESGGAPGQLLFTERELAAIGECVTGGLAYLHAHKGMAHLDIKPSNIMYIDGLDGDRRYLLSDFDVSMELLQEVQRRTAAKGAAETAESLGFSPAYAAPEQWGKDYKGEAESDLFAFAVTLYEVAFGRLPVAQGGLGRHMHYNPDEAAPALFQEGGLSQGFQAYLQPCLSRKPEDRPGAKYLQSHFKHFLMTGYWAGYAPEYPRPAVSPRKGSSLARTKVLAAGLALVLCFASWWWGAPLVQARFLVSAQQHLEEGGRGHLEAASRDIELALKLGPLPEAQQPLGHVPVMRESYSDIKPMKGHTAAVRHPQTGKWGFFDLSSGEEVVPCRYDEALAVEDVGVAIDHKQRRADFFRGGPEPVHAVSGVTFASFAPEGGVLLRRDTLGRSVTETITLDKLMKVLPSSTLLINPIKPE
ncbi:protein kinase domain-containing protein [Phaeodactylibacter luteus]|uniref:Protein kinase n=1 Tax=Phaeodactylibacter luteus TaxID=1564516 RepID=A0A5C6S255_9BACT|nr:protein kinase [Phaeodactylibacter luteus]TXB68315.1 protein kinase [Phaeodactylibacter luteus]